MKKILLLLVVLILSISPSCPNREIHFKNVFNQYVHGQLNVPLNEMIDIESDTFAIDVEFAPKWATSIGHSLYAAEKLNKKAGILLITYKDYDGKYVDMLTSVAYKYDITVWTIDYYHNTWKKINIHKCN